MKTLWIAISMLALSAFAQDGSNAAAEAATLRDIVASRPELSTLFNAVQAAGLEEELASGTYTLFAPTNAAFDELPEGTLEALLDDPLELSRLLQNHLVVGAIPSGQLVGFGSAITVLGEFVRVDPGSQGTLVIGEALASEVITAQNGVIYLIDAVLVPSGSDDN